MPHHHPDVYLHTVQWTCSVAGHSLLFLVAKDKVKSNKNQNWTLQPPHNTVLPLVTVCYTESCFCCRICGPRSCEALRSVFAHLDLDYVVCEGYFEKFAQTRVAVCACHGKDRLCHSVDKVESAAKGLRCFKVCKCGRVIVESSSRHCRSRLSVRISVRTNTSFA